jgi:hypothetical protein
LLVLVGCTPRQNKIVYPPLPVSQSFSAAAKQAAFVDPNSIVIRKELFQTIYEDWEKIGTNYIYSTAGPLGNGLTLIFPSQFREIYQVEGKQQELTLPTFCTNGWLGCNWRMRSIPVQGTGGPLAITIGVTGTEFFRVRKLD